MYQPSNSLSFSVLYDKFTSLRRILERASRFSKTSDASSYNAIEQTDEELNPILSAAYKREQGNPAALMWNVIDKEKGIDLGARKDKASSREIKVKNDATYIIASTIIIGMVDLLEGKLLEKLQESHKKPEKFIDFINKNKKKNHDMRVMVVILKYVHDNLNDVLADVNYQSRLPETIRNTLKNIKLTREQDECYGFSALEKILKEKEIENLQNEKGVDGKENDKKKNVVDVDEKKEKKTTLISIKKVSLSARSLFHMEKTKGEETPPSPRNMKSALSPRKKRTIGKSMRDVKTFFQVPPQPSTSDEEQELPATPKNLGEK